MTAELVVGDWIFRERLRVPHYVESIVSGDVITRCGRRMADEPTKSGGPLLLAVTDAGFSSRRCLLCAPGLR